MNITITGLFGNKTRLGALFVILLSVMQLFSCTNDNRTSSNELANIDVILPTSYQPNDLGALPESVSVNFPRASRVEGAWNASVKIANHTIINTDNKKIQGLNVLSDSSGNLISTHHIKSQQNLQTGQFTKTDTQLMRFDKGRNLWVDLPFPNFPAIENSAANLLSIQYRAADDKFYALWLYGNSLFLSTYHSINGWKDSVFVTTGVNASMKILENGNVLVWLSSVNDDSRIKVIKLSSDFLLLSSSELAATYSHVFFTETNKGLMAVWQSVASVGNAAKILSATYDDVFGWSVITNVNAINKSPMTEIKIVGLYHDLILEETQLIYVSTDTLSSMHMITHTNMGWGMPQKMGNERLDFSMASTDVSYFQNGTAAVLAWVVQRNNIANEKTQRLMSMDISAGKRWSLPINVSGDVSSRNVSLLFPIVNIFNGKNGKQKKIVSWVEREQSNNGVGIKRQELFVSSTSNDTWQLPELVSANINTIIGKPSIAFNAGVVGENIQSVAWMNEINNVVEKNISIWSSTQINTPGSQTIVSPAIDNIVFENSLAINSTDKIINPIIQAAHWSAPEQVWNKVFQGNLERHIYGPDLYLSNAKNAFLSIHEAVGYDPSINTYRKLQSHLVRKDRTGVWVNTLPYPAGTLGATFIEIIPVNNTGDAYAMWTQDGLLHFSHYIAGQGWQTNEAMGYKTYHYHLLVDSKNTGYLFWITDNMIHLAPYIPGVGLQPAATYIPGDVLFYAAPVMQTDDSVYMGWIGFPAVGATPYVPSNIVHAIRFDEVAGWGAELTAPRIDSFSYLGNRASLVSLPNNEVLAVTQDITGHIYASKFSENGGWGKWQNVDYNLNFSDVVMGQPQVTSNGLNAVMLAWYEKTWDEFGETVYRVYSNEYREVPDATGSNWPPPKRISSSPPSSLLNDWHVEMHPRIALSNTGKAIAVWIDENTTESNLLANEYIPGVGWGEQSDIIASYTIAVDGKMSTPRIAIANDDNALISWRQKLRGEFSFEMRAWVAEKIVPTVQAQ